MTRAVGGVLLALLCSGCAGAAEVVKALGQDSASVCVNLSTIYGTLKVARTNITGGNVSCTQDGLTVKSDTPTVPVNVQVVPR